MVRVHALWGRVSLCRGPGPRGRGNRYRRGYALAPTLTCGAPLVQDIAHENSRYRLPRPMGSELVAYFDERASSVIGIDNDTHADFVGQEGSTRWNLRC